MEYDYPKVAEWASNGAMQVIDLDEFKQVAPLPQAERLPTIIALVMASAIAFFQFFFIFFPPFKSK